MVDRLTAPTRQSALIIALAFLTTHCVYARVLYYNTPTLAAPTYFDARSVAPSKEPLVLPERQRQSVFDIRKARGKTYASFDSLLERNETRAFVVIHDGVIVYERYFDGFSRETLLPSFSISKTYAALLVGCAITDGLFSSVEAHLVDYVPALRSKPGYGAIQLEHLLRMTSGIDYDEESVQTPLLYYTEDLASYIGAYDVKWRPGSRYLYGSINIQLLWQALRAKVSQDSVARYFEERLWQPLGASRGATWSLDSREHGIEKLFAGFNATARDHALIALAYLYGGTLNGHAIVPETWVRDSLAVDPIAGVVEIEDGRMHRGKYQWFLTLDGRAFFAKGYRGQYLFVIPETKTVFVRFGEGYGDVSWPELFFALSHALQSSATSVATDQYTTRLAEKSALLGDGR
jgi:CubicO group peptidase (beta-lactamase class C family)